MPEAMPPPERPTVTARAVRGLGLRSAPVIALSVATLGVTSVVTLGTATSDQAARPSARPAAPSVALPLTPPTLEPLRWQAQAAALRRTPRHRRGAASPPVRRLPARLAVSATDIPKVVLAAYVNAANVADQEYLGCDLRWQVVAAIGYIESDNARSGGSYTAGWNGVAKPPILGPVLDGAHGFAAIRDTDGGKLDGNSTWDRAVGPMQFIPSTWARYAADGNHDGVRDPEQIDDATVAAADYLCADGGDLTQPAALVPAVLSYNHSKAYARDVLTVAARYLGVSPESLGVTPGELGVPKEKRRHHKKHRHPVERRRHHKGQPGAASDASSPAPSLSPSGSPAPKPSRSTAPSATPSDSATATPAPSTSSDSPTPSAAASDTGSASPAPNSN